MNDEDGFLRKLLENPADDTVRLVYADWLEERNEPAKSEFLRLTVGVSTARQKRRKSMEKRIQILAKGFGIKWLAVVSKLVIENCDSGGATVGIGTNSTRENPTYICPKKWENLEPTDKVDVRYCSGCQNEVFYADTIATASYHAECGRCVVVDLGVLRHRYDLVRFEVMGRFSPAMLDREAERRRLGTGSTERTPPDSI